MWQCADRQEPVGFVQTRYDFQNPSPICGQFLAKICSHFYANQTDESKIKIHLNPILLPQFVTASLNKVHKHP
jgi:hypothetical protein